MIPSFGIGYALLYASLGSAAVVFDETLSAFPYAASLLSALSWVLFAHLDNIAKDLTDVRQDVDRSAYQYAHKKLGELKREVISNGALFIFLLIFSSIIKGLATHLIARLATDQGEMLQYFSLSLRMSLFVVLIWAAITQIKGFVIAIEYREIIAANRK